MAVLAVRPTLDRLPDVWTVGDGSPRGVGRTGRIRPPHRQWLLPRGLEVLTLDHEMANLAAARRL